MSIFVIIKSYMSTQSIVSLGFMLSQSLTIQIM